MKYIENIKLFFVGKSLLVLLILLTSGTSGAADFSFKPVLTVSEEYTDNVFLTELNKKSDYITRTRPGFISKYNAPLWDWDINYTYDFRYYAKQSIKNDNTQQVDAKGLIKLVDEKLFLELSDVYQRISLDTVRDTSIQSLSYNQTDSNTATISPYVVLHPTSASTIKAGYRYINVIYKDPSAIDTVSHIGFMNGSYEVAPKLSVTLDYTFTRQESAVQTYNRNDAFLGSRYEYADKSFVFAMGGASLAHYNNGTQAVNPVWRGGITHAFATVVATLSTDVKYADSTQGAPNLTKNYALSVNKTMERGSFAVNASYTDYKASDNVILTSTIASVNQNSKSYTCGFNSKYELLTKLNGILGLTFNFLKNEQQKSITRQYDVNSGLDYTFVDELTGSLTYSYSNSASAQIASDNRKVNRIILELKKVF